MPKIAFLGAGRMVNAMVDGLLARQVCTPADLLCYTPSGRSAQALAARTGLPVAADLDALLAEADLLVLACKPQHLAGLDPRLAELTRDRLVLSVLAAKPLARLARTFPAARNLIRTMPNTPAAIGAGVTGWCALKPLAPADTDRAIVLTLLEALGRAVEIPESQIDALMAVSGCGPAFVFAFTSALRAAGVQAGLDPATAQLLAVETVLGAGRLMAHTQLDPDVLRAQVTSPQGTTLAGLQVMERRDFAGLLLETVLAAQARSRELSQQD